MLSLHLKNGEYLTIGDDVVVQIFSKTTVRVAVKAPREMTVLRGEVWERNGEERPDGLLGPKATKTNHEPQTVSPG